jgi:hypothetical protein
MCRIEERTYRFLVATPEKNNTFRRPRHRWDTNSKKDAKEIEWEGVKISSGKSVRS